MNERQLAKELVKLAKEITRKRKADAGDVQMTFFLNAADLVNFAKKQATPSEYNPVQEAIETAVEQVRNKHRATIQRDVKSLLKKDRQLSEHLNDIGATLK